MLAVGIGDWGLPLERRGLTNGLIDGGQLTPLLDTIQTHPPTEEPIGQTSDSGITLRIQNLMS